MKSCYAICLVLALAVVGNACGHGIVIDRVEPSNPWNGTVRIDYTVNAGVDDDSFGGRVSFSLVDAVGGSPVAVTTLFPNPPATGGRHSVLWDADSDGVTFCQQSARIVAKLELQKPYMVVDVSGGSASETFQVSFLDEPPPGGFATEMYMGGKIVLRRILEGSFVSGPRSGDIVLKASQAAASATREVTSFYIGIFEVTQAQYTNVKGTSVACANPNAYYPRDRVSYEDICGAGRSPANPVMAGSFAGILNAKCRAADGSNCWTIPVDGFDLPSQWEWEYACRAGTTTPYNSGSVLASTADAYIADLIPLGRFDQNMSDGKGGSTSKSTTVGSYLPNAWGLYDMHGNVWEWCRDAGVSNSSLRETRGGCSGNTYNICTSYARGSESPNYRSDYGGFRLYVPARAVPVFEYESLPVDIMFNFSACQRAQAARKVVNLDSRSGVRVVMQRSDIFPFAYSHTNFTGVAGVGAQSQAVISVVQLSGDGDDVSGWTQEIEGTRRILTSDQGEGTVKWVPSPGVWRAEFVIRNGGDVVHEESALFDLRRIVKRGFAIIFI